MFCLLRLAEGADTSHLEQVQHGYEKMDHFTANVELQRRALMRVDFLRRKTPWANNHKGASMLAQQ